MVWEYFQLQVKLTNRKFRDTGVHPVLGYALLLILFLAFSFGLFYKTRFAESVYVACALSVVIKLSELRRSDFLKQCFGNTNLYKIRVLENLLLSSPFLIFLLFKQLALSSLILFVVSATIALMNFRTTLNFAFPTPFYKRPFEFTVGFRNTFYLIIAAYLLAVVSIFVKNFNLGIFAMLLVYVICLTYYLAPEDEYYVWVHAKDARHFLFQKMKTALGFSLPLVLPVFVILVFADPMQWPLLLLFLGIGLVFMVFMVVAKYAAYPDELNITQGVFLAVSITFPPILLVLIPYLFFRSEQRLSQYFG